MRTIVLLLVLALTGGAYWLTRLHPEQMPSRAYRWIPGLGQIVAQPAAPVKRAPAKMTPVSQERPADPKTKKPATKKPAVPPPAPVNQVTLILTNGRSVTGELVKETSSEVVLRWEYGDASFTRAEIRKIEREAGIGGSPAE